MNGAYGFDVYGLSSTLLTRNWPLRMRSTSAVAAAPSSSISSSFLSLPVAGSKSLPAGMRRPSTVTRSACSSCAFVLANLPMRSHHDGRDKRHAFAFAFDDQSNGHTLHAAGGKLGSHLTPQQRRDFVTVQAVENSARFLRTDEAIVDVARRLQRGLDRVLGDFVENEPVNGHLRLKNFEQVPTDGLALAVFVRREIEGVGVFQLVLQELDLFALAGRNDVDRREIVVDVDAQVRPGLAFKLRRNLGRTLRQIADVTDARLDRKSAAQELADCPRFGGRFDNYQRVGWLAGCGFRGLFLGHYEGRFVSLGGVRSLACVCFRG